MGKANKKQVFANVVSLFIQEFFILVLLFTVVRYCDMNIHLLYLFQIDTCICVYGFTVLVLWITGCFKYAKGLFRALVGRELPNEKAGKNIFFFMKISILISIVINLVITIVGIISAGNDLQTAGVDIFPYVLSHHIAYIAGTAYYGLFLILFLLPIYIRVKMVMDQAEESNSQ